MWIVALYIANIAAVVTFCKRRGIPHRGYVAIAVFCVWLVWCCLIRAGRLVVHQLRLQIYTSKFAVCCFVHGCGVGCDGSGGGVVVAVAVALQSNTSHPTMVQMALHPEPWLKSEIEIKTAPKAMMNPNFCT